ncbi:MAG: hypothetical protein GC192_08580 [Bacteroidetes bacterium]|nr:hypothetical protein [Bacteroidota bacterium]
MHIQRPYVYLLSFLEGAAVMACELIGAKLLAPYFGTSLYVWAAALGLTLGGLMTGYFLGGIVSKRFEDNVRLLYWVLVFGGCTFFLMPFTSSWIMELTLHLNLQIGTVLSLLVFMFPPLVFMGMVSPIIINILTEEVKTAGNRAGNVYAISTLGGILATFLMGFYIIPEFGIRQPAMASGIILAFLPVISLLRKKKTTALFIWLAFLVFGAMSWSKKIEPENGWQIHYHAEGIMGQIKVIDFEPFKEQPGRKFRGLVVNNTLQTVVELNQPDKNFWHYTELLTSLTQQFPKGSKVLVCGTGGGTLVKRLVQLGFDVEAVEIDGRLEVLAKKYFGLQQDVPVILDDARHFIRTTSKKYDVIIYDTFRGESAPEHVITQESLFETKNCLLPNGYLLINFYGYWESERGNIGRSVYKTLCKSGFEPTVFATAGVEDDRNLVFCASAQNENVLPHQNIPSDENFGGEKVQVEATDTINAVVLTDEQPQLRRYAMAAAQWRKLYNDFYTQQFSKFKFF